PNRLIIKSADHPDQLLKTGAGNTYLSNNANAHTRLPGGHPEGYIESLANIYRNFSKAVYAYKKEGKNDGDFYDFPGISEGVRGMRFIEAVIESGKSNSTWVKI
ncbi:MAG: gfo/Idh/MocA family oxidoreductase, partial [Cytophagaceae bacterium]